jgi:pilus assembly protein CpaC
MTPLVKSNVSSQSLSNLSWAGCLIVLIWVVGAFTLAAADSSYKVTVNKTSFIQVKDQVNRVTLGDSRIADVTILDPNHLYILGKRLGSTNVILLCKKGPCNNATIQIEVTHNLEGLKAKLHELFPDELPKVMSSQGSIVLAGQVSSLQKMDAILQIASTFVLQGEQPPSEMKASSTQVSTSFGESSGSQSAGPQPGSSPGAPQGQKTGVINLMQVGGPQQVMLGVTVAEINRRLARDFKVDFSAIGSSGDFSAGAVGGNALVDALKTTVSTASVINPYGMFFRFIGHDVAIKTVINAAKENGLAKILAEPNLTVISGQDADFLSGGEFPVPVPQNMGVGGATTVTIQFKPFGVMLKFLPVVLDTGRISMKLNIDVSEISADNAVVLPSSSNESFVIPSLVKRSANSSLELDDGQTLGIAGLISDRMRESISKFPGLGDIPMLGQLFTSQKFLKEETELVIFVTPHLVKPIDPNNIRLPTDSYAEASDEEYYLMGRTEARKMPTRINTGQTYTGGLRGHFGQQP